MKKAEDYRKHAEECLRLARQARTTEHHQMLVQMADTWKSLAEERERVLDGRWNQAGSVSRLAAGARVR
jgi:hypothetical protein